MPARSPPTIELTPKAEAIPGRPADSADRSKEDAVADFGTRDPNIVRGIERGLEDMRAGRLVPHDRAMARLEAAIAAAEPGAV